MRPNSGIAPVEQHEPIGIPERQRAKQDAAHDAEDGGVGADAEGEREDDGEREAGRAPERAQGVAEVGDHASIHPSLRWIVRLP